jgi:hypothetical protein
MPTRGFNPAKIRGKGFSAVRHSWYKEPGILGIRKGAVITLPSGKLENPSFFGLAETSLGLGNPLCGPPKTPHQENPR